MVLAGYLLVLMSQDRDILLFKYFFTWKGHQKLKTNSDKGKTVAPLVGTTLPTAQRNITEVGFQTFDTLWAHQCENHFKALS